jgi:hypothetical protein
MDLPYSAQEEDQAIGRAKRQGQVRRVIAISPIHGIDDTYPYYQTRTVYLRRFVGSDTVDAEVRNLQIAKGVGRF